MENKDECEIAAVLAHEVKNPVAVIKSNLDYIRSDIPQNLMWRICLLI